MMAAEGATRVVRIAIASALMLAIVFVVAGSLRTANEPAQVPLAGGAPPMIASEAGVFDPGRPGRSSSETSPASEHGGRTLDVFYARRAYPGAPPPVPHPVADGRSIGGRSCTACHGDGGWVEAFAAYAPVTPHPELTSCLQCHVATGRAEPFRPTTYAPIAPPSSAAALPGSPPPIPHALQLRESCLACHAGPSAVREIRTTHPDRVNCRQCHVLSAGAVAASAGGLQP